MLVSSWPKPSLHSWSRMSGDVWLSFVSAFHCLQKGSGMTGFLGTAMMPII